MTAQQRRLAFGSSAGLLVAAAIWLAATAWLRPLMLPDEGRYVGVAWEMLRSGHWLVPTLDGLPYFHKPPLFYWITAASLAMFGHHEWAARAAPFLGALAAVGSLFWFASRRADAAVARLAVLALVTSPLLFGAAQFSNLDMLVAGCIAATIVMLADAALDLERGRPARGALLAGYAFAALGLLAKGLIGVVLPGMVIVAWVLLVLRRPRLLLSLLSVPGLLLFAAIGVPWFLAMQARFPDFLHYFFVVQHFKRFTTSGFNNPQPFWFYVAVLPLGMLPWSAWLPAAVRRWMQRAEPDRARVRGLMWLWLLLVTLFFSLPRSKLIGYILPATVPLAFLLADAMSLALRAVPQRTRRLVAAACAGGAALSLGLIAVVLAAPDKSHRAVGEAIARGAAPGDQVVFLHGYYFDVPFYARLRTPTPVIDDWNDKALMSHDDWRKELADADRFQASTAPPVLVLPARLGEILCGTRGATWLVGGSSVRSRYALLAGASEVMHQGNTTLWRIAPGAIKAERCRGTPSASSAGM